MLLQISDKVEPPKGFMQPDWQGLSQQWKARIERDGVEARRAVEEFPACTVQMGQDDSDAADLENPVDSKHSFGWDNEHGVRQVKGKDLLNYHLTEADRCYSTRFQSCSPSDIQQRLPRLCQANIS